MSWIPVKKEDYVRDRPKQTAKKNQTVVAPKARFPSQHKTKRCGLSPCPNPAVTTIKVGEKQLKKLCRKHRDEYFRGKEKQGIIMELDFRKASDMLNG